MYIAFQQPFGELKTNHGQEEIPATTLMGCLSEPVSQHRWVVRVPSIILSG